MSNAKPNRELIKKNIRDAVKNIKIKDFVFLMKQNEYSHEIQYGAKPNIKQPEWVEKIAKQIGEVAHSTIDNDEEGVEKNIAFSLIMINELLEEVIDDTFWNANTASRHLTDLQTFQLIKNLKSKYLLKHV